jgi:hypothetical protein
LWVLHNGEGLCEGERKGWWKLRKITQGNTERPEHSTLTALWVFEWQERLPWALCPELLDLPGTLTSWPQDIVFFDSPTHQPGRVSLAPSLGSIFSTLQGFLSKALPSLCYSPLPNGSFFQHLPENITCSDDFSGDVQPSLECKQTNTKKHLLGAGCHSRYISVILHYQG